MHFSVEIREVKFARQQNQIVTPKHLDTVYSSSSILCGHFSYGVGLW